MILLASFFWVIRAKCPKFAFWFARPVARKVGETRSRIGQCLRNRLAVFKVNPA